MQGISRKICMLCFVLIKGFFKKEEEVFGSGSFRYTGPALCSSSVHIARTKHQIWFSFIQTGGWAVAGGEVNSSSDKNAELWKCTAVKSNVDCNSLSLKFARFTCCREFHLSNFSSPDSFSCLVSSPPHVNGRVLLRFEWWFLDFVVLFSPGGWLSNTQMIWTESDIYIFFAFIYFINPLREIRAAVRPEPLRE